MERKQPNAHLQGGPHNGAFVTLGEPVLRSGSFTPEDDVLGGQYQRNQLAPEPWEYVEPIPETVQASEVKPGWVVSSSQLLRCQVLAVVEHFEEAKLTFLVRTLATRQTGKARLHTSDPFAVWNRGE